MCKHTDIRVSIQHKKVPFSLTQSLLFQFSRQFTARHEHLMLTEPMLRRAAHDMDPSISYILRAKCVKSHFHRLYKELSVARKVYKVQYTYL